MSLKAQPPRETTGVEGKIDFLNLQFEGLRQQISAMSTLLPRPRPVLRDNAQQILINDLLRMAGDYVKGGASISRSINASAMLISIPEEIPAELEQSMIAYTESKGVKLTIKQKPIKVNQ